MNTVTAHRVRISKVASSDAWPAWKWECECGRWFPWPTWARALQEGVIHLQIEGVRP